MIQRAQIRYRAGYKYQLMEDYRILTEIVLREIDTAFIRLAPGGLLTIRAGYAWDGPSGPTIDTPNFMRGSLVHDALYQLMREKHLPVECKAAADRLLEDVCRADGMCALRARWVYWAVDKFGRGAATSERPILTAP